MASLRLLQAGQPCAPCLHSCAEAEPVSICSGVLGPNGAPSFQVLVQFVTFQAVAPVMVGLHFGHGQGRSFCVWPGRPVQLIATNLGSRLSDTPDGGWSLTCWRRCWHSAGMAHWMPTVPARDPFHVDPDQSSKSEDARNEGSGISSCGSSLAPDNDSRSASTPEEHHNHPTTSPTAFPFLEIVWSAGNDDFRSEPARGTYVAEVSDRVRCWRHLWA